MDADSLPLHGTPACPLFKDAPVISAEVRTTQRPVAIKILRAQRFPCRGRWKLTMRTKRPDLGTSHVGLLRPYLCQFQIITPDKVCAIQPVPKVRCKGVVHGCMCDGGQRSISDVVPQGAMHPALETVFFLADRWSPRDVHLPRA